MSQHYSSDQVHAAYHSTYSAPTSSSSSSSRPPLNGLPQQTLSSAQSLPSITTAPYGYGPGIQTSYPPRDGVVTMNSAHANAINQTNLANYHVRPVYGPSTSHTTYNFFSGPNDSVPYAQPPERQQQTEPTGPPPLQMQPFPQAQPSYAAPTRTLPEIAPMPPRPSENQNQMAAYGNENRSPQQKEPPSHVVGAQGRRGILPSTAGRPAAIVGANMAGTKDMPLPPKNSDGKFPCLHCDKTYLHSKHLKRHLLRHTGIRPYICGLCTDQFSRSDILKRHFQKCSNRRGNPTGENHLAHSRKTNKKIKEQRENELVNSGTSLDQDGSLIPDYTSTSSDTSTEMGNLSLNQQNFDDRSNQVSRANSVTRSGMSTGTHSNRASLGMVNTPSYEPPGYAHSAGHDTPDSITTSGAVTPYTFHHDPRNIQLPDSEQFPIRSSDLSMIASSRPSTSSNYDYPTLPRIAGQGSSRGYNTDWSSYSYNSHDDYGNGPHHSGTSTPLDHEKHSHDFSNYQPYLGPKA